MIKHKKDGPVSSWARGALALEAANAAEKVARWTALHYQIARILEESEFGRCLSLGGAPQYLLTVADRILDAIAMSASGQDATRLEGEAPPARPEGIAQ